MRTKNLLAERPARSWLNVEVRAEDVAWVIAAFHFGEAGKRRGWIGRVEGSILICAEEAHVGSRPAVRREQFSLEVGSPSLMARRLREIGKRGVQPNQSPPIAVRERGCIVRRSRDGATQHAHIDQGCG